MAECGYAADASSAQPVAILPGIASRPAQHAVTKETDAGLLEELKVDPKMHISRLHRSASGLSFHTKYEIQEGKVLGDGMSGNVVLGRCKDTGAEVAIKSLSTAHLTSKQREQRLAEVKNQLTMDHPGICRLLEVYEESRRLVMVMERIKGSDLYEYMCEQKRMSEKEASSYVRQIASALVYCHSKGVCHRDLKLDNFCLSDPGTPEACVKMIDFGLSSDMSAPMTDSVGTLYYVAPEVVRRGEYDERCDVWSLGVLTFVMLCGRPPFQGADDRETVQRICMGAYNFPTARFSKEAGDFISGLLQVSPDSRLKGTDVLTHPWLAETAESDAATSVDPEVLPALRSFMRSNALKKAVLCAVAPVARLDELPQWEENFKALDKQGRGTISVQALTQQLHSQLNGSEAEALASSLAEADVDSEGTEISYSAFLAACLSSQLAQGGLNSRQLQEIFNSMDKDGDGFLTVEEISNSLGSSIDVDELRADLRTDGHDDGKVSFSFFRWLLLSPTRGLGPILQSLNGRIDTIRAKGVPGLTGNEAFEASRRENAAWRVWHRDRDGAVSSKEALESDSAEAVSSSSGPDLNLDDKLEPLSKDLLSKETATVIGEAGTNLVTAWTIATAEAKAGEIDARRRENMAWRKWNIETRSLEV